MNVPTLHVWKLISELDGFVAVVVATSAEQARCRIKARLLFDYPDKSDEFINNFFNLIDAAHAQRLDTTKAGILCRAKV